MLPGLRRLNMYLIWNPFGNSLGISRPMSMCLGCNPFGNSLGFFRPVAKQHMKTKQIKPELVPLHGMCVRAPPLGKGIPPWGHGGWGGVGWVGMGGTHDIAAPNYKTRPTREESDRYYTRILRQGKNPTVTIQESYPLG